MYKLQKKRHTQCVTPAVQGILLDQEAKRAIECLVDKIRATLVANCGHIDTESLGVDVDQQILSQETKDAAINWDYQPMQSLDAYLTPCPNGFPLSELSLSQYDLLVRTYGTNDDDLYLDYFNKSYYIFSQLLRRKYTYTQLRAYVRDQSFKDSLQAYWTWKYVSQLIDAMSDMVDNLQLYQTVIHWEIDRLESIVNPQESAIACPIYINEDVLKIQDMVRIVNAIIEMGGWIDAKGQPIKKKVGFAIVAALVHMPQLNNYSRKLDEDKGLSNKGNALRDIFCRLADAHEQWVKKRIEQTQSKK